MARAGRTRGIAVAALLVAALGLGPVADAAAGATAETPRDTTAGHDAAAEAVAETGADAAEAPDDTAAADAIAQRVLDALGGQEAWDSVRWIRFGFAGRRTHLWDRATGSHRLEGTTEEGEPYVVIQDLDTREGGAWVGGEPATGELLGELLERAWGAWVNDTYWLLMPFKLRDPGALLAAEDRREIDGRPHDVLHLRFADVGLTPGDRYWVFVDAETGLVSAWEYILEGQPPEGPATRWRWEGWAPHGPVMLAPRRVQEGSDRLLELAPIEVGTGEPPAGAFTAP